MPQYESYGNLLAYLRGRVAHRTLMQVQAPFPEALPLL